MSDFSFGHYFSGADLRILERGGVKICLRDNGPIQRGSGDAEMRDAI